MKTPATWLENPANVNPYSYNQLGVTYNTIYPIYNGQVAVGVTTKLPANYTNTGKNRGTFTKPGKVRATFTKIDKNRDSFTKPTKNRSSWV